MRNLIEFIIRYSHLLLFILLEVVAFLLITHYQPYQKSTVLTSANKLVSGINEAGDNTVAYFQLRRDNEALNAEVCRLQTQIQTLTNRLERETERDNMPDSTFYQYVQFTYRIIPAKVIDLTTKQEHNYLTLNKGSRDGVEAGMGVVCGNRVVGVVSRVNERFALVVPVIHTNINISSRIKKNDQIGFTHWKGITPTHVELREIGRHIPIEEGDTVVTSGLTSTFPEGVLLGVIDKVRLDEGDNYYDIRLRLATDFNTLRYVQVLDNKSFAMIDSLRSE